MSLLHTAEDLGAASELPGAVPTGYVLLVEQLGSRPGISAERTSLVDSAVGVWRRPGFDTLVSLSQLHFEPFDYQRRAASVVLRQMGGRGILADEVGLGKTIEAGIVLSELRLRGLAPRVLVVTPAGLVGQWAEELERKFGFPTVVASRNGWRTGGLPAGSGEDPVVLASLATARRDPLRGLLTAEDWDLVIVDEAHRVRNPTTSSSKLIRALRARFLLLLTATPVENSIDDLYHLVSLVRPGHLGTVADFRRRHGAGAERRADRSDPTKTGPATVPALAELRRSLRDVMVRHRRSEVALMLPRRLAETIPVQPTPEEAALYRRISERIRSEARATGAARSMVLRTAQRLAGSSPLAVAPTLERMGWQDLADEARRVRKCAKTAALATVLDRHAAAAEKVIVFTSFRETLAQLVAATADRGIRAVEYHGGLRRRDKDAVIEAFAGDCDVLLSTESAGEGRNLQFCHAMVNFDLPWNPMQIEQRLGRIHRIGQTHDVVLTNLASRGTIEERVLDVLHTKLNLFELVVGELDMVLGRVGEDFVFEDAVFEAHVASLDEDDLTERLEALGETLLRARAEHAESRAFTDALVAELEGAPDDGADCTRGAR